MASGQSSSNFRQIPRQNVFTSEQFRGNSNNFPNQSQQFQNNTQKLARKSFLRYLDDIPTFRGDSRKDLYSFIEVCDIINDFVQNEAEYSEFLMKICFQLRGEAKTAISRNTS